MRLSVIFNVAVALLIAVMLPLRADADSRLSGDASTFSHGDCEDLNLADREVAGAKSNTATVIQGGGGGNVTIIRQSGTSNVARQTQSGARNRAVVEQEGISNSAKQSQVGSDNRAESRQEGDDNSVTQTQEGRHHKHSVVIKGSGVTVSVQQLKDDDRKN